MRGEMKTLIIIRRLRRRLQFGLADFFSADIWPRLKIRRLWGVIQSHVRLHTMRHDEPVVPPLKESGLSVLSLSWHYYSD